METFTLFTMGHSGGESGGGTKEPVQPNPRCQSICQLSPPHTYAQEGHLIAHKNDLLGVSVFNKLSGGVGQTPEDKVGFLPFSIITENLMVRKESQRRGGQENGQERVDRQGSIVGRAWGGPSLCFRVC